MTEQQEQKSGKAPDWNICQEKTDAKGVTTLEMVGGMWDNKSAKGKAYKSIRIGKLSLVAYPNEHEKTEQSKL